MVAELWFYLDGSRILELSTKCAPTERLPGRRRDQGISHRQRGTPPRRTADENEGSTRVFRRQHGNRCRGLGCRLSRVAV